MSNKKENFGDIIQNHDLVKRTLMVSAFPALIKQVKKGSQIFYKGFLPGFEFCEVDDMENEDELVETLQDMLDDEVEELVVFGKSLPNLPEDEELLKNHKGYKIVYLDINVYASKDDEDFYDCAHDCSTCNGHCNAEYEDYCGCEDDDCSCEDDCEDEDCGCHHNGCNCGHEHDKHHKKEKTSKN